MSENNRPSLREPEILFLTFFGTGFAPKAPGTMGTLATLPFLYFLGQFNPPLFVFVPLLFMLTVVSCFIADRAQIKHKVHDPSWIVMDEVLGMSVTWLFSQSFHIGHLLILFVLFRFFDIVKIWPASYFDKNVLHGSGTILDDIISAFYAGGVYLLINKLLLAS
jgi:phosphatidylglycerophosphatase A